MIGYNQCKTNLITCKDIHCVIPTLITRQKKKNIMKKDKAVKYSTLMNLSLALQSLMSKKKRLKEKIS